MKKNLNIIKINGLRGILFAGMVISCLAAGFIAFPGYVAMHVWNYAAIALNVPQIGLLQGVLLWGIIVASYFTFRKNKVVVCIKTPQGLSEEELKEVFADMKKQSKEDPILQAMLKAREAELKIQKHDETEIKSEK
ncbi:MAG: hypothetical protein NC408_06475 [Candidatus Gastranaerophilales bacterium]|nr:hypothetical protein [Candidatus Gastranaerophilales bacterium]MCM1072842.1 hypothetical protein [Bacteroides sp.]